MPQREIVQRVHRMPAPRTASRAPSVFVWGVWALMSLLLLAFVIRYGSRVPYLDDWALVPHITGSSPVTLPWLWLDEYGPHRQPVFKLIAIGLIRLTAGDFRAVPIFCALALSGLAFAMVWVVRRTRGRASYADAFIPIVLLRWRGTESLYTFQLTFLLSILLAAVVLLVIVRRGTRLTLGAGLVAGICLVLLPLCGACGLAYVPALSLWLGWSGVVRLRSPEPRGKREGLLFLALALTGLLLVPTYLIGMRGAESADALFPPSPDVRTALVSTLEFFTGSIGPAAVQTWPYSGLVMLGLILLSVLLLLITLWRGPAPDRSRALGLLCFMGAVGSLALGVGWGRGGYGQGVVLATYGTLALPMLCCIYLAWGVCRSKAVGNVAQVVLFALVCSGLALSVQSSRLEARAHHDGLAAFEKDVRAGSSPCTLLIRHRRAINACWGDDALMAEYMGMMRRAGYGPFRDLKEDPPAREVPVPVIPTLVQGMSWVDGRGQGEGPNSFLTVALPAPTYVHAIRIQCSHSNGDAAYFQVSWRTKDSADFPETPQFVCPAFAGPSPTMFVADTIDQIRIHPDARPFHIQISAITLLVPGDGDQTLANILQAGR